MTSIEQKAQHLVDAAKRKVSSKGFFESLFKNSNRFEEAIELYQKAANLYKISKNWTSAGNAFCQAAKINLKRSQHVAAINLVDAANCYKKCNTRDAVNCLLKAIELYTEMGRFSMTAKRHQNIAEMYEYGGELEQAVSHYEQAAHYFRTEENNTSANRCLLKVALYTTHLGNYAKAVEIYEQVATSALENSLLKYSVKKYLTKATLCHLCLDAKNARSALACYLQMYPPLQESREFKLLNALIEAYSQKNVEDFTEAMKEFDTISHMDQWYATILSRLRKKIGNGSTTDAR